MYCNKCGGQNDDNANKCVICGEVLQRVGGLGVPAMRIPNYLVQSILVTLLCCLPLGIPAIVFSAQVNGKIQAGDVTGAMEASRKAKMWCLRSIQFGLFVSVIYVTIFVIISSVYSYR